MREKKIYVLMGNSEAIIYRKGSYNDCLKKLHHIQPFSWDYALKWGGWKIVEYNPTKHNKYQNVGS